MRAVMARIAEEDGLQPGVSIEEATDVAWAVASAHQYEFLVVTAGWDVARYREHLERTISSRLLKPA